jgi:hypothetical protein
MRADVDAQRAVVGADPALHAADRIGDHQGRDHRAALEDVACDERGEACVRSGGRVRAGDRAGRPDGPGNVGLRAAEHSPEAGHPRRAVAGRGCVAGAVARGSGLRSAVAHDIRTPRSSRWRRPGLQRGRSRRPPIAYSAVWSETGKVSRPDRCVRRGAGPLPGPDVWQMLGVRPSGAHGPSGRATWADWVSRAPRHASRTGTEVAWRSPPTHGDLRVRVVRGCGTPEPHSRARSRRRPGPRPQRVRPSARVDPHAGSSRARRAPRGRALVTCDRPTATSARPPRTAPASGSPDSRMLRSGPTSRSRSPSGGRGRS